MRLWLTDVTEAVSQRCSVKKVFLEISQKSQETSKNTFFNRISLMVASEVAMRWVQTKNTFHIKERNRGIPYVSIDVKNCVNKN